MTFQHPQWLLLLPPLLAAYWFMRSNRKSDDWRKALNPKLLLWYTKEGQNNNKRIPALLLSLITTLALASPSIPGSTTESEKKKQAFAHAQGWLLILDLSKSVTLTDIVPNRLNAMRETAKRISNQAEAIPVGLIIYAGDAFLIAPPAIDKSFLEEKLALLEFGLINSEGSNPTRAIALANSVLQSAGITTARTFLLTDGGGLSTRTAPAINNLASFGHRLDLLLFGEEIPAGESSNDSEQLASLADAGNGKVVKSDVLGNVSLKALDVQTSVVSSALFDRGGFFILQPDNQSHWLLILAIPLCLYLFARGYRI